MHPTDAVGVSIGCVACLRPSKTQSGFEAGLGNQGLNTNRIHFDYAHTVVLTVQRIDSVVASCWHAPH